MKLLFVVDGRSPIALNWIRYFIETGHEVHMVSIYPCQPDLDLTSLSVIPVAFSGAVEHGSQEKSSHWISKMVRAIATTSVRTWLRHQFVPHSLPAAAEQLVSLIEKIQPDLVHAMRVPYEGMLTALAYSKPIAHNAPLLLSIWGNDFTLHAPATRKLTQLTRLTLRSADALHTDCHRDQRLAQSWGFEGSRPSIVLPGAGGIQLDDFYPPTDEPGPIVINPRGLRAYVRNDTFFNAIPLVLARHPQARFDCPTMAGQPEPQRRVEALGIGHAVDLMPRLSRAEMANQFRKAQIVVSPTTHDGTPNTLLEAMACGCLPVVGDIESLREWITPGVNGLLVDPGDPHALADAICEGLENPEFRARAKEKNARLIAERAEYSSVMKQAEAFYFGFVRL